MAPSSRCDECAGDGCAHVTHDLTLLVEIEELEAENERLRALILDLNDWCEGQSDWWTDDHGLRVRISADPR